ncbi:MAG TPA: tetratricopeptide repeat protein [Verrucomicrobiae bacterium]|jgi:predicted negative regulator of RcsB-dependent stress response|nr:tetratricopeptide repeat protein [Verrucomicrobiae bacterium]
MQTQDAPAEFLFKLWPWLEANKNRLIGGLVAVIVVAGILYFMSAQKAQTEVDAGQALTAIMANPAADENDSQTAAQFEQLADKYPGTAAARRAQLQAAGALFEAGSYADAETQFEKYLAGNSAGPLAATAQLGIAASLEAQNKLDQAAAAYQRVVSAFPESPCVPTADLALGRIAEQQNKLTEALNHYEDASRSPMGGSIANEAMIRATALKAKTPATAPKAMASPAPAAGAPFKPMSTPQPATK